MFSQSNSKFNRVHSKNFNYQNSQITIQDSNKARNFNFSTLKNRQTMVNSTVTSQLHESINLHVGRPSQ